MTKVTTNTSFYVIEEPPVGSQLDKLAGTHAMLEDGFITGAAPSCPGCGRFIGSLAWLPPYRVEIETWGRQFGDILIVGEELLISSRFKQLYEQHELRGLFGFDPVEVVKVKRHRRFAQELPQYFKVNVVRSTTAVDPVRSGYEWKDEKVVCPVCLLTDLKRYERIVIKAGTWAGEDIFYPRGGPVNHVTSQRFKEVCEAYQVTNVVFIPCEEYSESDDF